MSETKVMLQRWPFELSSAHICEACDYLCAPGIAVCPKCQTRLGEFSRPVKIDAAAAEAMATLNKTPATFVPKPIPALVPLATAEILTRCPHCDGVLSLGLRGV